MRDLRAGWNSDTATADEICLGSGAGGVAGRLAELRRRRGVDGGAACDRVRDLVVVCASSRGGSSVFGELLRRCDGLVHTTAEVNPHVRIATLGLNEPESFVDPGTVAAAGPRLEVLRAELAADLGQPVNRIVDVDAFALQVAWRLTMQWPDEEIDPASVTVWVREALDEMRAHDGRLDGAIRDRDPLLLRVLARARVKHPELDPRRYDVARALLDLHFPRLPEPSGPHTAEPLEMAPFVVPRPWRSATPAELADSPLVLSTPRNTYRIDLLRAAFPNARVRILHLTRNPAAAVNGLMDGWHHHGFFSIAVGGLDIAGYSDVHPRWGRRWWCYDLPPGWQGWTSAPLAEVCAFQWRSAHAATLAAASASGDDYHLIAHEDVVGPADRRDPALRRLASWLGLDPAELSRAGASSLPVVMPTEPPRPGRWRDRAAEIIPVVTTPQMLDLARALGYPADPDRWD